MQRVLNTVLNYIASVELERVGFGGTFGEHNCRVERTETAGCTVRDKMNVGKLLGIAGQVCSRSGLHALINLLLRRGKMFGDVCHLLAGSREFRIFAAWSNAVTDEQQTARTL